MESIFTPWRKILLKPPTKGDSTPDPSVKAML